VTICGGLCARGITCPIPQTLDIRENQPGLALNLLRWVWAFLPEHQHNANLNVLNVSVMYQRILDRKIMTENSAQDTATHTAIQSIYTDGACTGNPGPGGWGVVVYFVDGSRQEIGGGDRQTTNNRMEMQAAIAALEYFRTTVASSTLQARVPLYTDSEYVLKGITEWIKGWKRRGWKNSQGKPVLNQDLWEILDDLNHAGVNWQHVRGHSGVAGNERCDQIARAYAAGRVPDLQQDLPA
jgi:ribonuclease HI